MKGRGEEAPPGIPRAVLRVSLPRGVRSNAILGDLDEEFRIRLQKGPAAMARRWYRRQAMGVVLRYALPRRLGRRPRPSYGDGPRDGGLGASLLRELAEDVRYALRRLIQSPAITALALVTLAVTIGANTAIFTVVDSVILRPLPFPEPERIVQIWETKPELVAERQLDYADFGVNALDYLEYERSNRTFESLAYLAPYADVGTISVGGADLPPEMVGAWSVSPTLFDVLGVQPVRGRAFMPEETAPPGDFRWTDVAIISHELWVRRFRSDPGILGSEIMLDAGPSTVVGILPPGFEIPPFLRRGELISAHADVLLPLFYPAFSQPRSFHQFQVLARLTPDADPDQARADLARVASGLAEAEPEARAGWNPELAPVQQLLSRQYGTGLYTLMGAVGFVLLIGCANLANLLLAVGTARRGELAIRAAMGGGQRRIMRQLLTESLVLAGVGGVLGVAVAWFGTRAIVTVIPSSLPRIPGGALDVRVLTFALVATVGTGLVFGLLPAVKSSRMNLSAMIKTGGRAIGSDTGPGGVSRSLIVSQVTLTVILLVGASLLMKSFAHLRSVDVGFNSRDVLVGQIYLGAHHKFARVAPDDSTALMARWETMYRVHDAVASVPGVATVSLAGPLPFSQDESVWPIQFEPVPRGEEPEHTQVSALTYATPEYFQVMGIDIVRGRGLPGWDRTNDWKRYWWSTDCPQGQEAYCAAVVSETFAATAWPGEDPIGKELGVYGCCWRVVGVARDVRHHGIDGPALPGQMKPGLQVYAPASELSPLVLKTTRDPNLVMAGVRQAVRAVDPAASVTFTTMESRVSDSLAKPRFYLSLMGFFGGVALLLSLVGLYGVASYTVGRRTHEIGVRIALGATRLGVHRMVVGQAMKPVLIGVVLGIAGALALSRVMAALLYGADPVDPMLLGGIAVCIALVSAGASYVPARGASRVDPVRALAVE